MNRTQPLTVARLSYSISNRFSSIEVEATSLANKIANALIGWGWIVRQLARIEEERLKS